MFIFSNRNFICTILAIILLVSILFNGILFYAVKKYYTQYRATAVFPTSGAFYQSANAALPNKTRKPKRVILFGDSRIQQWKNLPLPQLIGEGEGKGEGIELINRGIGGETTAQLRARFEQDVLALNPDVVILQLGINDLVAIGVLPHRVEAIAQQCQDNLKFFVETLTKRSIDVILLSIIPPTKPSIARLPVWSEQIPQHVEDINQYWLKLPATARLHVIDTTKVLKDAQGQWYTGVNKDTLHLTHKGYKYLNQAVIAILSTL